MSSARSLLLAALVVAAPAAAQQQSESYKFLQAIRESKGNDVIAMLDRPGSQIIDTRAIDSGEGALHIVVKRGDETYLRFLLQKGADPNLRDGRGNTPLMLAVDQGEVAMIPILAAAKANPNLANASGETPLIRAVQRRDPAMVRELLAAGADPDQTDNIAGMSAREYAKRDGRNPAITKMLADIASKPKRAAVAGPTF